ncbi:tellurium resistance protein [Actibacterium sp.]|uniref:SLAC1 family transporter n=1 Tax=Actibacterium sp. TaxID=1872125 RepID=UPI003561D209
MRQNSLRAKFAQSTPPAIFPPIFGLFGLGLAWRRAELALAVPDAVAQILLGAVTALYLFALLAYLVKVARRPGVVVEDLRVLPGRAGLAGMVLSMYLLGATLLPVSLTLANLALWVGLLMHGVLVVLMLRLLTRGPVEQRQVTPVWHLVFVGFIIAPVVAVPLGYGAASEVILIATGLCAAVIWVISFGQLLRRDPPPPLRPLLAIHLSPAALLGIVSLMLGHVQMAQGFALWASVILAVLVVRARYLTAAGFSAMWGAFTFPMAAYASLMLSLGAAGKGQGFEIAGTVTLVAATLIIPPIAIKVMQGWAKGQLAVKTNAARA